MIFPALREAIRDMKAGFGSEPIRLDIEQKGGGTGVEWYARNGFRNLYELHSGGSSWSGEHVDEAKATNLSVVWACRRLISEPAAFIPLELMQETSTGKFPAKTHPLYSLLKRAPNDEMSAMVFRESQVANIIMHGNSFAQIIRRSGTGQVMELQPLVPAQVQMDRDQQKRRVYIVDPNTPQAKTYTVVPGKPHDIAHIIGPSITGREGQGVVTQARQSLGSAASAERYAARYYARGGRQPGYIKLDNTFKKKQEEDAWVDDLNKAMDGPDGWFKWPVFQPGVTFQPAGWSQKDSQFLETRQFNVPEMCRWFLISPDMVGDMSKATLNNMEQVMLRFSKITLTSWLTRIEQDWWRCLLTPEEKASGVYYLRHNINGLMRGDFLARMQGYAIALTNGMKNIDGIRDLEDENALPNGAGQAYRVPMNLATVPGTGEPTAVEAAAIAKAGASGAKDLISSGEGFEAQRLGFEVAAMRQDLETLKQLILSQQE